MDRWICPDCGHEVAPAAPARRGGALLREAIGRATSGEAVITAVAFALVYAVGQLSWFVVWLYTAALVAYYFTAVRFVADGHDGFPGPSDTVLASAEVIAVALAGVVCVAIGFVPLAIWLWRTDTELGAWPQLELAWLVAGQLYVPAVLLAIVISGRFSAVLWPVAWIQVVARAPAAYTRFLLLWLLSVLAGLALLLATAPLRDWFFVGHLLAATLWNLFWFAQAMLVGAFIRQHAEPLGWHDRG